MSDKGSKGSDPAPAGFHFGSSGNKGQIRCSISPRFTTTATMASRVYVVSGPGAIAPICGLGLGSQLESIASEVLSVFQ